MRLQQECVIRANLVPVFRGASCGLRCSVLCPLSSVLCPLSSETPIPPVFDIFFNGFISSVMHKTQVYCSRLFLILNRVSQLDTFVFLLTVCAWLRDTFLSTATEKYPKESRPVNKPQAVPCATRHQRGLLNSLLASLKQAKALIR